MPCHKAGHLICIKMLKINSNDVQCQHKEGTIKWNDQCQVFPSNNNSIDKQDDENKE